ncbi:MAG: UDP-N-acetylmuramoyl-L-alanyl-D-glutamate--2,6-diaminopimelate ligase [Clostridia bacterium]|nr:UDP-N-acetylmuramoyl-L-alanyl-D-glutamate--2,6-diaminopimelate ligase [Clostridia bacterium]
MRLFQLLEGAGYGFCGVKDADVTLVTEDSRKVCQGSVFVCVKGAHFDGHDLAADAVRNGAVLIVAQHDTGCENQLIVEDTREAFSLLAASFFSNPARKLRLVGVTGTNGKTTTCFLLKAIFESLGHKTGLVGTVKNMVGDKEYDAHLTTPDPFELNSLFAEMVEAGCEFCVMEVSSQALAQQRVAGLHYESAVFTNLTQDHLDYHGNFENYIAAKHKLFEMCDTAVINCDDEVHTAMVEGTSCRKVKYSVMSDKADYSAKNAEYKTSGVSYILVGFGRLERIKMRIPGDFTVYNSMGAAVCAVELGLPMDEVAKALGEAAGVPGRIEVVPTDTDFTVIIDYAHSPDGLQNILAALRKIARARVITVFGCGGDRDKTKRPQMGKIAADMSDFVVITSDNPRTEDPQTIVNEVAEGAKGAKVPVVTITDRTQAIEFALNEANENDIVLLAGKGHETYQIIGTEKRHYDEREVVRELLNK